ncbi:oxygenase MpaB family protein [Paramicrobacterium fandaimingii]|uniref:oxygenase MpaB family protein n=1 Tax=Paramicrobacterium fandaimingii TaxID=2708079 RepID=UPI00141EC72B|nr:oxygenase MpaB family protein [Microbacterium fandaimingii]
MRQVRELRDVAAEAVLIVGGGSAILLQIADERVGLGVAHHSDFASRPLDRLHATLTYVYVQAYGTAAERRYVARKVGVAHQPVRSDAAGQRPAYSASDPDLQLWVAATLYRTAIGLHERVYGPLPDKTTEHIYREYAVLGAALGMPKSLWPTDRAAFDDYWSRALSALRVTPEARRVARDLLHPRIAPLWLKAAMPLARLVTAGLLDDTLRDAYGLPWSSSRQRRFTAFMTITRMLWPRLPRGIRHRPAIRYLRRVRAEMTSH